LLKKAVVVENAIAQVARLGAPAESRDHVCNVLVTQRDDATIRLGSGEVSG
jgi:hypothetical protein